MSVLLGSSSVAEVASKQADAKLSHTARARSELKLFGGIDMRPGMNTSSGDFSTENSMEIGAALSASTKLSYVQELNSVNENGAQNAQIGDGSIRLKLESLWERKEWNFTFSDYIRVYFPTATTKRDAGMLFSIRNYFVWNRKVSETFSFQFSEVPILYVYSEPGVMTAKGAAANPTFENRIIVGPTVTFVPELTLALPLHFYTKKYRRYLPKSSNNDEWTPYLSFQPELNYQLTSNVYTGVGYRTDNLLSVTENGTTFADGVGLEVFQLILGITF